jgi:hypothetical protein
MNAAPRGRPPVGPVIEVRLPADTLAALDAEAAVQQVTRAAMVREALNEWVIEHLGPGHLTEWARGKP